MMILRVWLIMICVVLGSLRAPTQDIVWQITGVTGSYTIGTHPMLRIGDMNGDGFDDVMLVAVVAGTPYDSNEIRFLSGRDGSTLRRGVSVTGGQFIHSMSQAGDVDGDGVPDYIVTIADAAPVSYPDQRVQVRSGRDDRLMQEFSGLVWEPGSPYLAFGVSVLGDLDVNRDGRPDVVVLVEERTNPQRPHFGCVYVFDTNGTLILRLAGTALRRFGGGIWSLGRLGDLDGDGHDDFTVGGRDAGVNLGAAAVVSGRTGQIVRWLLSPVLSEALGYSTNGVPDLDGDGLSDVLASSFGGGSERGLMVVFSSSTGSVLRQWTGTGPGSFLGWTSPRTITDLDGDGSPDISVRGDVSPAVVPVPPGTGYISWTVLSFRDGTRNSQVSVFDTGSLGFSRYREAFPPLPGETFGYVLIGDEYGFDRHFPSRLMPGRLTLWRMSPQGATTEGTACAGVLIDRPRIGMHRRVPATAHRITVSRAPANAAAVLVVGLSNRIQGGLSLPLPLGPFGFPGCELGASVDLVLASTTGSTGLSRGYTHVDLDPPRHWVHWPTGVAGTRPGAPQSVPLHIQWIVLSQAGGGVTERIRWIP